MKLHFKKIGCGEPIMIIHGLFGSSDNWGMLGKKFAEKFSVYLIDLRNHGRSPHDSSMNYELMADDLHKLLNRMERSDCENVIMEVSSHSISQKRVHGIKFNMTIFTNLSEEHLDFHSSMDDYFCQKKKLFYQMKNNFSPIIINIDDNYGLKLYEELTKAGEELNIKPFGGRALMSMRLEKNWGAWTLDYRPDFTAKETGLDVFINWNKDFIGKDCAQKDESKNKLVPLIVETNDIDVTYNEAVLKGDKSIGYITSGGFAHFVNKSVAFSYIDQNEIKSDKGIQVEINGDFFNCSIIKEPLYDPNGQKMRS